MIFLTYAEKQIVEVIGFRIFPTVPLRIAFFNSLMRTHPEMIAVYVLSAAWICGVFRAANLEITSLLLKIGFYTERPDTGVCKTGYDIYIGKPDFG